MYNPAPSLIIEDIKKRREQRHRKKVRKRFLVLFFFIFVIISIKSLYSIRELIIQNQINQYKKVEIIVEKGDTVWNLQEKLTPNGDIEKLLYLAERRAGHSFSNIKPGEKIILLK